MKKRKQRAFPISYAGCVVRPDQWQHPPPDYPAPSCIKPTTDPMSADRRYKSWAPHVPTEPPGPVTASVRCGGSMHDIVYQNGALHFPAHPQLARNETLFEMGARCRCLEVREAWREGKESLLPAKLVPVYRFVVRARRGYRQHLRTAQFNAGSNFPPDLDREALAAVAAINASGVLGLADALDSVAAQDKFQSFVYMVPEAVRPRYASTAAVFRDGKTPYYVAGVHRGSYTTVKETESKATARRQPGNRTMTIPCERLLSLGWAADRARSQVHNISSKFEAEPENWETRIEKLIVHLKPSWNHKVFSRGLSVVEGRFVLDVLTGFDLTWFRALTPEFRDQLPAAFAWWLPYGECPPIDSANPIVLTIKRANNSFVPWPARVTGPVDARTITLFGDET